MRTTCKTVFAIGDLVHAYFYEGSKFLSSAMAQNGNQMLLVAIFEHNSDSNRAPASFAFIETGKSVPDDAEFIASVFAVRTELHLYRLPNAEITEDVIAQLDTIERQIELAKSGILLGGGLPA